MDSSPKKQQSTSKVIDSLHSQIDELKNELETVKLSHNDYRKKNTILANKTESLVDQLANCKHENDMINALLKRKERRIADLEGELDTVCSSSESLKLSVKNYKIRCENLESSSVNSTAELERMKISYDALVAAQNEYKRHYTDELAALTAQMGSFREEASTNMAELSSKFQSNDRDIEALLGSLSNKRAAMDNVYVSRTKVVMNSLALLAKVAKAHGEECQSLLADNIDVINQLREKFPDIAEKVAEHQEATVDLDELLGHSASALDLNFETRTASPDAETAHAPPSSRKKKRNSMRVSSDYSESIPDILPRVRNSPKPSRQSSDHQRHQRRQNSSQSDFRDRTDSRSESHRAESHRPDSHRSDSHRSDHRTGSRGSSRSETGHRFNGRASSSNLDDNHNKNNKRRSFHGGSNNFNKGTNDRRVSQKKMDENI